MYSLFKVYTHYFEFLRKIFFCFIYFCWESSGYRVVDLSSMDQIQSFLNSIFTLFSINGILILGRKLVVLTKSR